MLETYEGNGWGKNDFSSFKDTICINDKPASASIAW